MVSKKVLRWLRWFNDYNSDKRNEAIAENNHELAQDLTPLINEVAEFIRKHEAKQA